MQCIECNYFSTTKANYYRHIKSKLHLRICSEINNSEGVCKYGCKCGRRMRSRQSLAYHKKNCSMSKVEESKVVEKIDVNTIDEIKTKLQPISLFNFINGIVFEMDDFEYYSLTDENIMVNTMIIFKRALDLIEPNKRPFHNFNENPDLYYIHSFIMDKWKIENQVSILKVLQKNCDTNYEKNTFLFYMNVFHQKRIEFYKSHFKIDRSILTNLLCFSGRNNQDELIENVMKLVCYRYYSQLLPSFL